MWEAKRGKGSFPWGEAQRALGSLKNHYKPERIAERLAIYLAESLARAPSLALFAQKFDAYMSLDELIFEDQPSVADGATAEWVEKRMQQPTGDRRGAGDD